MILVRLDRLEPLDTSILVIDSNYVGQLETKYIFYLYIRKLNNKY